MSTQTTSPILGEPLEAVTCDCGAIVKVKGLPPLSKVECPKCGAMFPLPVKLGQFHLLKRLGQGSMGEVFEAKDIALGRHVAIKVMGKKVAADEDSMRAFVREARNLAALNHRNVVQVHTIGVEKGQPYIVMELVSGGRVDQMIRKDIPGDERRTLEIAIDAARGLEAAAKAGMVHGDVKPANILLDPQGQGKIVDFGLARLGEAHEEGKIYGTPFYLPPELLEGKPADYRSDIFSLGASLYHVLVGRPPFRGKTVKDIVRARLVDAAPNLRQVAPGCHPATAAVIARMLQRNPDERHQSYEELVGDLAAAIATLDNPNMSGEIAELSEAITVPERAARSGRVTMPEPGERSRSRLTREEGARTVARMSHREIEDTQGKSPLVWIIGGAVLLVAVIVIIIIASSGGGETPGKLAGGSYRLVDNDPVKEPGLKRPIGGGACEVMFHAAKLESAGRGEVFKFEIWDDQYHGLLLHLYNDQGACYLEIRKTDASLGPTLMGKTRFDALPKSLRLSARFAPDTKRWRIEYAADGQPMKLAEGGQVDGFSGGRGGRYVQARVDQFGNAGTTAMELGEVAVTPAP